VREEDEVDLSWAWAGRWARRADAPADGVVDRLRDELQR
jgi:hypothetical protein